MRKIRVLIACEESQAEVIEFRKAGCLAFSCDLQLCSGNHPEWHVVSDCLALFQTPCVFRTQDGKKHTVLHWDLVISHPPCTYLSRAAAIYLFPGHVLNKKRYQLGLLAKDFFMACYNVDAPFVVVENPVPFRIFNLPKPSCSIHPRDFGAPWKKQTLYWLKNLPPLMATIIHPKPKSYVYSTRGGKKRSKSFPEVAQQMVVQWLPIVRDYVRENNKTMHSSL